MSSDSSSKKRIEPKKSLTEKFIGKRNFGHPLAVLISAIAIFLLSQLVATIFIAIGFALSHERNVASAFEKPLPQFLFILLAEFLAVYLVFWVLKKRQLPLSKIGIRPFRFTDAAKGLLGVLVFYFLVFVASLILFHLFPHLDTNQKQDVGFNQLNTRLDDLLAFIGLVFLPPIGEEVLVRGYLFSGLRERLKFVPATLITSILFGVAHLQLGQGAGVLWLAAIDTFILSLVLCYLRETTGALWAGMLVHGINNFIAFGIHFRGTLF